MRTYDGGIGDGKLKVCEFVVLGNMRGARQIEKETDHPIFADAKHAHEAFRQAHQSKLPSRHFPSSRSRTPPSVEVRIHWHDWQSHQSDRAKRPAVRAGAATHQNSPPDAPRKRQPSPLKPTNGDLPRPIRFDQACPSCNHFAPKHTLSWASATRS